MKNQNKVEFGFKLAYYAVITETLSALGEWQVSYGKPKRIHGTVRLTLDPKGDEVAFEAEDDEHYYSDTPNQGFSGSLEMAVLSDDFREDVLGQTRDANGVLIENKDAALKKFALLFETKGDANKARYVIYRLTPSRPALSPETGSKKEAKSISINVTASPALDTGNVTARAIAGQTPFDSWYGSVYTEVAATTHTITASTSGANGSISPNGAISVKSGGSAVFVIHPDSGYEISSVMVDGTDISASLTDNTYTFTNVKANHTIDATFAETV